MVASMSPDSLCEISLSIAAAPISAFSFVDPKGFVVRTRTLANSTNPAGRFL